MARKKNPSEEQPPLVKAKGKPKPTKRAATAAQAVDEAFGKQHPLARRRALVAAVLAVVAVMTLGGRAIWQFVGPTVAGRERYLLKADQVSISDLPEWINGDVRSQVIQNSGLADRLSILDANFNAKVEAAFTLHPWVESVARIEKRPPAGVHVELAYRRPVAVIDVPQEQGMQLLPVDARGVHLPVGDVPEIRRSYLPRITGIVGQPPPGQRWDDPRVPGAVDLAVSLGAEWDALNLTSIVPSAWPVVVAGYSATGGDRNYFTYDLVNRGGTRIGWGASPHTQLPGEADFSTKLKRLKQCVAQYSALEWVYWPERIDIRRGIEVTPRQAKKSADGAAEPVVANAPAEAGAEDAPVVK